MLMRRPQTWAAFVPWLVRHWRTWALESVKAQATWGMFYKQLPNKDKTPLRRDFARAFEVIQTHIAASNTSALSPVRTPACCALPAQLHAPKLPLTAPRAALHAAVHVGH